MKRPTLAKQHEKLRSAVREQLQALLTLFGKLHAPTEDNETVMSALGQLSELFLLVVVGEFNSGKSTAINALLGRAVVEEGVLPTTTRIQVLKYGADGDSAVLDPATTTIPAEIPLLQDISIVDTPGTNAIERRHEAITTHFIPRADLVVFVTSADRPFSESERAFLSRIRDWGKKIVIVINKIDILQTSGDLDRVEAYVQGNAGQLLGISPEVFPVSSRSAFRAKVEGDASLLRESRFEALEDYMVRKLDQQERVRLKLLNPLGVGCHLAERHAAALEQELETLRLDLQTLEQVENQLALYRRDMSRDFRLRLSDVENVLHELEARGHEFVEDMVRLPRIYDLLNKEKVKGEFVRRVVADAPERVEKRVDDIIDWLVASDLKQWQLLKEHVARRRSERSKRDVGDLTSVFDYDRSRLVDSVGRTVQKTLESYDRHTEAGRMAESVQSAVAGTALIEVGAVGLGAAVALVASSTAADVTGLFAAGVLATVGFLIIPHKRRAAKRELHDKIVALRESLTSALTRQFDSEVERSLRRLREGIAPYSGFVRAQEQSLAEIRSELAAVHRALLHLREEVTGFGA